MRPERIAIIAEFLRRKIGFAVHSRDMATLASRLEPIAPKLGLASVEEVVDRMARSDGIVDPPLVNAVTEAFVNHESYFFRDPALFQTLKKTLLPEFYAADGDQPIRIWSAACATGQEPYSLAILLSETKRDLPGLNFSILASDISDAALEKARDGIYTEFEVGRGLSPELLDRYFERTSGGWRVLASLRRAVKFHKLNLVDDIRFPSQMDIVFCRNVLMYFDGGVRQRVLDGIRKIIRPGGYLVLGGTELYACPDEQFAQTIGANIALFKKAGNGERQMSRTENFRRQHDELLAIAGELAKVLDSNALTKNAGPARTILNRFTGKLILHLSMEDNSLYPELLSHSDTGLSAKAKSFNDEMGVIKEVFAAYSKKWSTTTAIQTMAPEFVKETQGLIEALGKRIQRENEDLYQLIDKVAA